MNYSIVYDSTRSNLWWWLTELPILILGSLFVGLILRWLWRFPGAPKKQRQVLWALVALVCVGGLRRLSYRYYFSRHFYLDYGPCTTIAGVVKNYKTLPTASTVGEQFEVNGIRFGYVDSFQWKCFHKAARNGGPIREGIPVRISYATPHFAPCIVKLEVADAKR